MAFVFIALLVLAFAHFVYEAIIAPTLRLHLRFKLFALRDHVRSLKADSGDALDDHVFDTLHDSLNTGLRMLARTDLVFLFRVHAAFENDQELRQEAQRRFQLVEESPLPDVKRINDETGRVFLESVLVNNGALGFYLVPVVLALVCWRKVARSVGRLLLLPENRAEGLFPAGDAQQYLGAT